jgi:hypothetical protein
MRKYLLVGSLALNLGLAIIVVLEHSPWGRSAPGQSTAEVSLRELYKWGRDASLPSAALGQIVLDRLRAAGPPGEAEAYWQPRAQREAKRAVQRMVFQQHAREVLTREFGPAANTDPAFKAVFEPYAESYPFLPPDKQVALQQLLLRDGQEFVQSAAGAAAARTWEPSATAQAAIKALLTADEHFEYQLRESALSDRLSRGTFAFTEGEFREVFRAYQASDAVEPHGVSGIPVPRSVDASTSFQGDVERILGQERFAEYKRGRDPIYGMLASSATKLRVAESVVDSAYALIQDAERKAVAIKLDDKTPSEAKRRSLANLYEARNRDLKKHMGDALYSELEVVLAPQRSALSAGRPMLARQSGARR